MISFRLTARPVLMFGLALTAYAGATQPPARPDSVAREAVVRMTIADLEKGLKSSPAAPAMAAVKRYYPEEYRLMLEEMLARIKASDGSFAAAHLIGAESMRAFMLRRVPELVNAPPALLNRINRGQLELMRSLAGNQVGLCAEYATTGFTGKTPLPAPYLAQTGALSVLMIEASRAGADRPREAGRGTLNNEDAVAWYQAVHRVGTAKDVIDAFEANGPPSPDMSCRMGIAVYAAIDALPSEQAARLSAYFFKTAMSGEAPK